jgi:hypothetical protein
MTIGMIAVANTETKINGTNIITPINTSGPLNSKAMEVISIIKKAALPNFRVGNDTSLPFPDMISKIFSPSFFASAIVIVGTVIPLHYNKYKIL